MPSKQVWFSLPHPRLVGMPRWAPARYIVGELPRVLWPEVSGEPLFLLRHRVPWDLGVGVVKKAVLEGRVAKAMEFKLQRLVTREECQVIASEMGGSLGEEEPLSALHELAWRLGSEKRREMRRVSKMWGLDRVPLLDLMGGIGGMERVRILRQVAEYTRALVAAASECGTTNS